MVFCCASKLAEGCSNTQKSKAGRPLWRTRYVLQYKPINRTRGINPPLLDAPKKIPPVPVATCSSAKTGTGLQNVSPQHFSKHANVCLLSASCQLSRSIAECLIHWKAGLRHGEEDEMALDREYFR